MWQKKKKSSEMRNEAPTRGEGCPKRLSTRGDLKLRAGSSGRTKRNTSERRKTVQTISRQRARAKPAIPTHFITRVELIRPEKNRSSSNEGKERRAPTREPQKTELKFFREGKKSRPAFGRQRRLRDPISHRNRHQQTRWKKKPKDRSKQPHKKSRAKGNRDKQGAPVRKTSGTQGLNQPLKEYLPPYQKNKEGESIYENAKPYIEEIPRT